MKTTRQANPVCTCLDTRLVPKYRYQPSYLNKRSHTSIHIQSLFSLDKICNITLIIKTTYIKPENRTLLHLLATPTSYLVPALSHETRDIKQAFTCLSPAYAVCIWTLPHNMGITHRLQSTPNLCR